MNYSRKRKRFKVFMMIFVMLFTISQISSAYESYVLADKKGNILEGENIDKVHPLAALTKLMTGLVAVKQVEEGKFNYDDIITVSRETANVRGSSVRLRKGQKVTLEDLLKGTIVRSGNDAAYGVAEYISGSEEKFVELMNQEAKKMGLSETIFYTSTGLPTNMTDKPMDVGTAADMAILTSEALKYPKIMEIANLEIITIGNSRFKNRITLLDDMDELDGLKTGYHSKAKYNLILTSYKNNMRLAAIIMGAENESERDNKGKELLELGYEGYHKKQIGVAGEFVLKTSIKRAVTKEIDLYLKNDLNVVIKKGDDWKIKKIAYINKDIEGPVEIEEKLGDLRVEYRNQIFEMVDLVPQESVEKISTMRKFLRAITFGLF